VSARQSIASSSLLSWFFSLTPGPSPEFGSLPYPGGKHQRPARASAQY